MQVLRIAMIGVTVSDMERSVAFYEHVLGFEKVAETQVTGGAYDMLSGVFASNMRIAHLKLDGQTVELTQYISHEGRPIPVPWRANDHWFQHMAIVVSDMEKAYETVRRHGVRQISLEPQTIPQENVVAGGIKAFKFRDPDNHALELLWFPSDKGHAHWRRPTKRLFLGIDHTASARQFQPEQIAVNIEFLHYESPPSGRPIPLDTTAADLWHWQTSLAVEDIAAAANALRAAGVRFVSPDVVMIPDSKLGFSRAIMVRDPDGHAVRLVQR